MTNHRLSKKILVIDGHPVFIHKTEGFLNSLTYEDVILASTGKEALDKLISLRPDLVILSGTLPDVDSRELCRAIRSQYRSAGIIVQTGLFTSEEDVQSFRQSGADAVVDRKEKDLNPLQQAVMALLHPSLPSS